MPIIPYAQHGAGQVPLQGFLPHVPSTASISSAVLPAYPSIASSSLPDLGSETPNVAPDASDGPLVQVSIQQPLDEQAQSASGTCIESADTSDGQMKGRKPAIAAGGTFFGLFSLSQIYQHVLFQRITPPSERADEASFVGSSRSWLDKSACNWFGLCGLAHLDRTHWVGEDVTNKQTVHVAHGDRKQKINLDDFAKDAQALPEDWSEKEFGDRDIPQYVLDHAPLIHLYSGEEFWPGDMVDHLYHTTPHLNYTPLQAVDDHPTLENLDHLNDWGRFVYLTSDDNPEEIPPPEWLAGESNIPNIPDDPGAEDPDEGDESGGHFEEDKEAEKSSWYFSGVGDSKDRGGIRPTGSTSSASTVPTQTPEGEEFAETEKNWQSELHRRRIDRRGRKLVGGKSDAPAVLIVVPKDDGVVDAFWFFFYSFNKGNSVFNVVFGNHVGDWEHTTVRFQHGVPKAIFFSEHSFGEAYTWEAVEKSGKRVSPPTHYR